jgi:hypothetical protein
MAAQSRFTRFADTRASELTDALYEMFSREAELSSEEQAAEDADMREDEAVEAVISIQIETAMVVGYFIGMLDGRRDALGLGGERFANGESIRSAEEQVLEIYQRAASVSPTDKFIARQLRAIEQMPIGLSGQDLAKLGSEVR